MNTAEYAAWAEAAIPPYAADKVRSGRWPEAQAIDLARKEFEQLLPKQQETAGNYFFNVVGDNSETVGSLWFAKAQRVGYEIAYVYDIVIQQEYRRRGHAMRALQALEVEASLLGLAGVALHVFGHNEGAIALYRKLGFEPTNINMYKALPTCQRSEA